MNSEDLPLPGGRDVRATLDTPENADPEAIVVACPPHPQHRGHRGDARLEAVSEALVAEGVACLRFDYGDWDEGYGEREDARNALRWARERYDRVGIFGFSFGGAIAVLAAATVDPQPDAVALLAPASRLTNGLAASPLDQTEAHDASRDLDAAAALEDVTGPVLVVYGTRDETANWRRLVERAEELGHETVEMGADHFFVGQHGKVADAVSGFLVAGLRER